MSLKEFIYDLERLDEISEYTAQGSTQMCWNTINFDIIYKNIYLTFIKTLKL
jgi:hypothetical protein